MSTKISDLPLRVGGSAGRTLLVGPSESPTGFATIADAITEAQSGDVIFVQPGTYDEALVVDKDYITIVGAQLGGYGRPDVVCSTGVALTVTGQGFVCKRMRFATEADADVVKQYGNGFVYEDCVIDGDSAQGATKAGIRLVSSDTDDSLTASEGVIDDCLIRGSDGYGIAFDTGAAAVTGVGPTHVVVRGCRFISNVAEDVIALDTGAGGAYCIQDCLFERCFFGMGTSKNKATHIDIKTNGGANNTGNVFAGCYVNDDTIDTTAIKSDGTGSSFIGCFNLDGAINGDAID